MNIITQQMSIVVNDLLLLRWKKLRNNHNILAEYFCLSLSNFGEINKISIFITSTLETSNYTYLIYLKQCFNIQNSTQISLNIRKIVTKLEIGMHFDLISISDIMIISLINMSYHLNSYLTSSYLLQFGQIIIELLRIRISNAF